MSSDEIPQPRWIKFTLWAALMVSIPIPFFMVEIGYAPAVWLAYVTAALFGVIVLDGFSANWLICLLFTLQTAAAAGVLYLVAAVGVRLLNGIRAAGTRRLIVWILIVFLLGVSQMPIYKNHLMNVGQRHHLIDLF